MSIIENKVNGKPLGGNAYGSIGHLVGSKMGPSDHHCPEGYNRICTVKSRSKHDIVIAQEKLDGANMAVAKINGVIVPLTRSGYVANTSQYDHHRMFYDWAIYNEKRFRDLLLDGERAAGEWLIKAHGTRYQLTHEPFVIFDILKKNKRLVLKELEKRIEDRFVMPHVASRGPAISIADALQCLGKHGQHGAMEEIEGIVYRVETIRDDEPVVDFLAKWVNPNKENGKYLPEITLQKAIWNTFLP